MPRSSNSPARATPLTADEYERHRRVATHVEALYTEINKLATKKPVDPITPLIAKKINLALAKVREVVSDDEFLDHVESVPVEAQMIRFDEALIVLGELRSALVRTWNSPAFEKLRSSSSLRFDKQILT